MFGILIVLLTVAAASLSPPLAAQTVKVGLINSYTGFVAQAADEGGKAFDLYLKLHEKELPEASSSSSSSAMTPPIPRSPSASRRN